MQQNTYLVKGDKVLAKGDGNTIWTVVDAQPQTRDRLVVEANGLRERRAYNSLKKIGKMEMSVINAYNSLMNF